MISLFLDNENTPEEQIFFPKSKKITSADYSIETNSWTNSITERFLHSLR